MRREHTKLDNYIDWLKSLGCVFYCAFDGVNGTNDLINNVPLTLSGNGSISYEPSLDMYSITTPSSQGQDIGYWDNGIGKTTFNNDDFSAIYTAKKITTTNGKSMHGVTPYSNNFRTCQALDMLYNSTGNVTEWPSTVTKVASSFSTTNGWRRYYQNGALFVEYAIFAQYQPSNWVTSGNRLCLARTPVDSNSTHREVSLHIGETYIFNVALDLQTIRKIQGYE